MVGGEVGAFGEDEEPGGVEGSLRVGGVCRSVEFVELALHDGFVVGPFARHEDEAKELQTGAEDGDPFQAVFEHDVDVTRYVGHVGCEPEVGPVGVDLVVGDENGSFVKGAFDSAVALV